MIIYKTVNIINNKVYIGQDSKNNPNYLGSGILLHYAIKKYGIENFKKETICECKDKNDLDEKKIFWIKFYSSTDRKLGYNISPGGQGGKLLEIESKKGKTYDIYYGVEKSHEIKKKLSAKRRLRKNTYINSTKEEVAQKISKSLKLKNIKRSEKQKKQISESVHSFFESPEGAILKHRISERQKGTKLSDTHKQKIANSLKGKRPKVLDMPSSKKWFVYDRNNNLVAEKIGDKKDILKELNILRHKTAKFNNLNDCFSYILPSNKDYKIVWEKKCHNRVIT